MHGFKFTIFLLARLAVNAIKLVSSIHNKECAIQVTLDFVVPYIIPPLG